MKIKIVEYHGGFLVEYDESTYVYESRAERILQMLEEIGKRIYGKRVSVKEK
jgi:hypothetical protein